MDEAELTALLGRHACRHAVPGAAIGVLREGSVTTSYCGVADVTIGEPVTADLMEALFGIGVPPLRLTASAGAAGALSRFAGIYAWPDRRVDVAATANGLLITSDHGQTQAVPLDKRTFLLDAADPDTPTVTFGAFDKVGRPRVLYNMLWGLPRIGV